MPSLLLLDETPDDATLFLLKRTAHGITLMARVRTTGVEWQVCSITPEGYLKVHYDLPTNLGLQVDVDGQIISEEI